MHRTEAVKAVTEVLGMRAVEGSGSIAKDARTHVLMLAGHFRGAALALARAHIFYDHAGLRVAGKILF